jgi:hypothetical protein
VAVTSTKPGLDRDPATRHWLHDPERTWSETNCYTDLWVQLLHRLGLDPLPALGFAVGTRFDTEQWTFAKPPVEDLFRLYGIRVVELYVWRPLLDHVRLAAERGNLLTIEVDAHWLPDTAGTTYRNGHDKTTIVPVAVDADVTIMRYLHNGGCFDVTGEDLDALFATGTGEPGLPLPPYTELIDLTGLRRDAPDPGVVRALLRDHLRRAPATNPVSDLARQVEQDLAWLTDAGVETFHLYAFATARQCGAVASMSAAFTRMLDALDGGLERAAAGFEDAAEGAKTLQFLMARAARGRSVDMTPVFAAMEQGWATAIELLADRYAR